MRLVLKTTRFIGVAIALCLLILLLALFIENLGNYRPKDFILGQLLPVYLPYFALLTLLLLPFSRIRSALIWKTLLIAMAFLSLVWFVPVAYRAAVSPRFDVAKPPGEGVAPKILITHSYAELRDAGLIAGFLLTQILAIWSMRSLRDPLAHTRAA